MSLDDILKHDKRNRGRGDKKGGKGDKKGDNKKGDKPPRREVRDDTIFFKDMSPEATEEQVKEHFGAAGEIVEYKKIEFRKRRDAKADDKPLQGGLTNYNILQFRLEFPEKTKSIINLITILESKLVLNSDFDNN